MNEKYSSLFTPWKIGNCEIKNRIVQVSMGGTSLFGWLEPCHFDKEAAYHILNRAQNNVGLVLPGMQCVRDTMGIPGRHWLYQNKRMFRELAEWMPEFHKTGAKLFIQLSAGMGRSMAINQLMVDMLQKKALGRRRQGRSGRRLCLRVLLRDPQPLVSGGQVPRADKGRDPRNDRSLRQDREDAYGCRR